MAIAAPSTLPTQTSAQNSLAGNGDQDERTLLLDFWLAEAQQPFSGWDFSYILDTGRMRTSPATWGYASEILPRLRQAEAMLDMGTGGGELLSLLRPLPRRTFATEGYAPNLPVARARLEPLGVQVAEVVREGHLPFAGDHFDLVVNRHESYEPAEVWRVLRPGGVFITQQVGGEDEWDLNMLLGARPNLEWADWRLTTAAKQAEEAGFTVLKATEDFPATRFFDVGALVYYLKAVPWQVADFSVERYFDALLHIHHRIQDQGFLEVRSHRFLIVGRKPAV